MHDDMALNKDHHMMKPSRIKNTETFVKVKLANIPVENLVMKYENWLQTVIKS